MRFFQAEDDCTPDSISLQQTSVQEVTLTRGFRTETQTHSQGILVRTAATFSHTSASWLGPSQLERPPSAGYSERSMEFVANEITAHSEWLREGSTSLLSSSQLVLAGSAAEGLAFLNCLDTFCRDSHIQISCSTSP